MLDIVYYPVSAVLRLWHTVFAAAFGPASGVAWVLAVICLIATFRAALIPSFLKQARNQAAMRRLRPRVAAIQRANANDRAEQSEQIRALHAEHGVGLFVGCLPALVQGVVFLGLFHVLRSFDRTTAVGHLPFQAIATPMTPEQNAATPNYVFDAADVRSFLDADLFGAPLSATLAGHAGVAVAAVSITLMVVAAVATHLTARIAVARQDPDMPQARLLNTLTLWVFPAGALLGGAVLPIAILVYWVANNAWTAAQQYLVHRRVAAESAVAERATVERRASAPKPGAKPVRTKSRRADG
ncbi:membrane protein insertase YidC [Nocardia bovistercoris]|uniref:Membrane protein insertase YidC n=1 Tax=Nocardia bovistercoris TaxID=2785916 RepID=A0A931IFN3_9NOCA|nr:membrane protein insertase YidC [Nocardia bovistercoris]MBH0779683.1 membrane protein insertase YidC [Nocardia bovistercoris]